MPLANITYLKGSHPDQGLPGEPDYPSQGPGFPTPPIVLPPLPPDLKPDHPIVLPPDVPPSVAPPIYYPVTPEHPIALPPGQIWPPLPPDMGVAGKVLILIYVVGVGYRWFYTDGPSVYPPVPTPK